MVKEYVNTATFDAFFFAKFCSLWTGQSFKLTLDWYSNRKMFRNDSWLFLATELNCVIILELFFSIDCKGGGATNFFPLTSSQNWPSREARRKENSPPWRADAPFLETHTYRKWRKRDKKISSVIWSGFARSGYRRAKTPRRNFRSIRIERKPKKLEFWLRFFFLQARPYNFTIHPNNKPVLIKPHRKNQTPSK